MQTIQLRAVLRFALLVAVPLAAGCYPKSAPPPGSVSAGSVTWASTKWPGETEASLAAGKDTFMAKCNGCHGYPDFAAISDEKWPSIVERMGKKSDLDAKKTEGVLHYILASKHQ